MEREPITYQKLVDTFKNSNPLIQAVVMAFFSQKFEEGVKGLQQLVDGIRDDQSGTPEAREEAAEGLEHLISAAKKMTPAEREYLRLKIKQEWNL